jgi:peptidoglycan LD-endopeptidase CwlK
MPTENFKRISLDLLYPPFLEKLLEVIARCNERGHKYVATYGHRTYSEQMDLWKLGRVLPGAIVTNARGGESAHNFGLAVDFVRDVDAKKPGVQPSWKKDDYAVLIEETEAEGLHSGHTYNDVPHVGWPGLITAKDLKPLHEVWVKADGYPLDRLKRVWELLDKGE